MRSTVIRKFTERQSLFWIFSGVVVMICGLFPSVSGLIATVFDVKYTPSIIFAIAIVMTMYGIFLCFQSIAGLHNQIHELAMQVSLLNYENSVLLKTLKQMNAPIPEVPQESAENEYVTK